MNETRAARAGEARPAVSPEAKLTMALVLPPLAGIVLQGLALFGLGLPQADLLTRALLYLGVGMASWSLALRWGRLADAGLRGKRALYFGLTVGILAALPLLAARLALVEVTGVAAPDAESVRTAAFEMLFAGLCGQLWFFGVLYNAVRDVAEARRPGRGVPAAVLVCGLLYGLAYAAWLGLARAPADPNAARAAYFVVLGVSLALGRWRGASVAGLAVGWGFVAWITWDMLAAPGYESAPLLMWLIAIVLQGAVVWLLGRGAAAGGTHDNTGRQ